MAMDNAAIAEAAVADPSEHRGIVTMGVDSYVGNPRPAIIQTDVGNALCSRGGGNAVDSAVRVIVEPFSFDDVICGVIAYDESEDTGNLSINHNLTAVARFYICCYDISERISVDPLVGISTPGHPHPRKIIYPHDLIQILNPCFRYNRTFHHKLI